MKSKHTIKFTFGEVNVESKDKQLGVSGTYPMPCWPHGVAVIINNENFKNIHKDRPGSNFDEENLAEVMRNLGYIAEVYKNCTAKQILEIVEEKGTSDHSHYDSFVCCILSHGKLGLVLGSDEVYVSLENISEKLNCKSLANKPKMFFLQGKELIQYRCSGR